MSSIKQDGTATLLFIAVMFPVFCLLLAASPAQTTAAPACHHSAPQPLTPPSNQKCCAAGPATKALLSARYTPPAPLIVGQAPATGVSVSSIDCTPANGTAIPAAPPGFRVLRI
jgi:hypothetical protein